MPARPSQEPMLPWRTLPDDRDILELLHWRFRLAADLIGRGAERAQLLDWANGDKQPRAHFLVGPDVDWKTRLAAEVADRLRQAPWLVLSERQRLTNMSEALGFEAPAAGRLLGLAAAAGGLNADAVRRLADPALELGLAEPGRAVDRVQHLPWWEGDRLPAPSPDLVAAALLLQVLAERADRAPEWLWAVLQDSGPRSWRTGWHAWVTTTPR